MRLVVVTGVSGAGKSTALRALEDLGYYCADNLPMPLLPKFVELLSTRAEIDRAGLVIDARGGEFLQGTTSILADIRAAAHSLEVLYLDAGDDILLRRFSETRRRHPLSDTDIRAGLRAERDQLQLLRQEANAVVDTGGLTVHLLRALIQERYGGAEDDLAVTLMSFGFKYGLPTESDIVLDVRFLPNPFFVPNLSALSGEDEAVVAFVMQNPETRTFVDKAEELLKLSIQGFRREGKSYATVAIGCTGGRHRSVVIAKELGQRLRTDLSISIRHRDIQRTSAT
jgi:RNase adapter protein RapZ